MWNLPRPYQHLAGIVAIVRAIVFWEFMDTTSSKHCLEASSLQFGPVWSCVFTCLFVFVSFPHLFLIVLPLPKRAFRHTHISLDVEYLGVDSMYALVLPHAFLEDGARLCLTETDLFRGTELENSGCLTLYIPSSMPSPVPWLYFITLVLFRIASDLFSNFTIRSRQLAFAWHCSLAVFVLCGVDMFKDYHFLIRFYSCTLYRVTMCVTMASAGSQWPCACY